MDALLSNYGEPDDVPTVSLPATKVNIAPAVNAVQVQPRLFFLPIRLAFIQFKTGYQVKEQREVKWNPEYDTLFAPIQGKDLCSYSPCPDAQFQVLNIPLYLAPV